ncbi:MAG TPA: farnesyl diphosphate synthase [Tepidisphaeraceae bacterium]|nr:farnesyl diphosphate synthase [Tepidisphaeraceae bacterium]
MDIEANNSALSILKRDGEEVAQHFERVLARYTQAPPKLMEAIRYSLLAGGKRLRPALVLETYRACAEPQTSAGYASALAAAGSLELIHTFSLVHDDLPAMDNDDLRRGRPTNHKVFGEAMAILAGDAMTTMAFELLAVGSAPALGGRLVVELASASGPEGMIGGQVLDMEGEHKTLSLEQLRELHRRKTGALLTAAGRLGAIAAEASESKLNAITAFGQHLGLAFQIVDDLLDVTSTPEQMGKATHKDAEKGKNTYPVLLGMEASRQEAAKQLQAALDALNPLGDSGSALRALARFVVERQM